MVLIGCNAFSQSNEVSYPYSILIDSDTAIVFSLNQSKHFIFLNENLKSCVQYKELCDIQLDESDQLISAQTSTIDNFKLMLNKYELIINQKNDLNDICEQEKKYANVETKKHKRQKIISIIAGSFSTALMTFLYVKK
jgi:hypothetical protein